MCEATTRCRITREMAEKSGSRMERSWKRSRVSSEIMGYTSYIHVITRGGKKRSQDRM